ncbi:MAG: hypothetical protein ACI9MC_000389 [Kiritimatiellia bacterium]|jgi:hypothetical protein
MKLYRAKVDDIAIETIKVLMENGDIEVLQDSREEAEQDLIAIMEEFLRRDNELRTSIKDHMASRKLPYGDYGKVRKQFMDRAGHPQRDDIERFLSRQFVECLMITRHVEEVWAEDEDLYKRVRDVLRSHDVDEDVLREQAAAKVKNVTEGTVEYEIAIREALREIKKRHGLI